MRNVNTLRLQIERSLEARFPAALSPAPRTIRETAPTGIAAVDELLDGGFPVGAISELVGPASSGRTSLAISFLSQRTAEGRVCAWVDAEDALDPESAAASGVRLGQLLWVRCNLKAKQEKKKTKQEKDTGRGSIRLYAPQTCCCRRAALRRWCSIWQASIRGRELAFRWQPGSAIVRPPTAHVVRCWCWAAPPMRSRAPRWCSTWRRCVRGRRAAR